ncbi:hypothetical protein [Paenibacillus ihumii]|uniref:hypothetical protein n=1 Tax=Paenibacillus ihumii TaxID=687436 RepID=UPI0006D857FC|nr:hypothetical protein [Paenibacillus ihumii]
MVVEAGQNYSQDQIFYLSFEGKQIFLFVERPPQGFDFNYLSTLKNQPSVVCEGDEDNTDIYRRNGWSFIIDTKTGDMTKGNLAY